MPRSVEAFATSVSLRPSELGQGRPRRSGVPCLPSCGDPTMDFGSPYLDQRARVPPHETSGVVGMGVDRQHPVGAQLDELGHRPLSPFASARSSW